MNQLIIDDKQEEWLKVLGKGMVTLPKRWRDEMGITSGDMVKAKKKGNAVIIVSQQANLAPYRVYSDSEIDEFLKADVLPSVLLKKVQGNLAAK